MAANIRPLGVTVVTHCRWEQAFGAIQVIWALEDGRFHH
jgi:hypothetical protein